MNKKLCPHIFDVVPAQRNALAPPFLPALEASLEVNFFEHTKVKLLVTVW